MPSTIEITLPATSLPLPVPRVRLVTKRRAALALGVLTSVLIPVLAFRGAGLSETGRLIAASNVWALALGGCAAGAGRRHRHRIPVGRGLPWPTAPRPPAGRADRVVQPGARHQGRRIGRAFPGRAERVRLAATRPEGVGTVTVPVGRGDGF